MYYHATDTSATFKDHTLLLGVPSIGNVGQLTTELILYNQRCRRVGHLTSPHLTPLVGHQSWGGEEEEGMLHTEGEVYQIPDQQVTFVLIRSPPVKGHTLLLARDLHRWLRSLPLRSVQVLSSGNASWRHDDLLSASSPLQVWQIPCHHHHQGHTSSSPSDTSNANTTTNTNTSFPVLPSTEREHFLTGFTRQIWQAAQEMEMEDGPDFRILLMFCNEGDNLPHALGMADVLGRRFLDSPPTPTSPPAGEIDAGDKNEQQPIQWQIPPSWRCLA